MSRKIIQISTDSSGENENSWGWSSLYALCDDGTLWELDTGKDDKAWESIKQVPQGKV